MGGSSRTIPIDQFSKANQRLNKQHAAQGSSHQGTLNECNGLLSFQTRNALDCASLMYTRRTLFCRKNLTLEPYMRWIGWPVAEIWPLEIFKMVAGRHIRFGPTISSIVWSIDPENPTLEPNMRRIRRPVAEILPFEIATRCHLGFGPSGSWAVRSGTTLCELSLTNTLNWPTLKT